MIHTKYFISFLAAFLCCISLSASEFSLAINHGRVIDPETGLDGIRHIGITGGKITKISENPLQGNKTLNVSGLVVSPGFIDLHTHSPTQLGQYYQVFDGVTTALELEMGAFPVTSYASEIADKALINFGASIGYLSLRVLQKQGIEYVHLTSKPKPVSLNGWWTGFKTLFMDLSAAMKDTFSENASTADISAIKMNIESGLKQGGIGIGLALDYFSEAVNNEELESIFSIAAENKVTVFVHMRRGINGDPAGLFEVLGLAKKYGSSLHICHLTHNSMKNTELFLAEIKKAQAEGVDVTTEVLPYNAGSALISAAVFSRDWKTIFAIDYGDIEWSETGERFTEDTWMKARESHPQSGVIHHYLKEEFTQMAVKEPGVIIVSDLLPMLDKDKKVAPHNGAFSKVLGQYVREKKLIDLSIAISKMTLLPALRLESFAPVFKSKGRIQVGADADITIFNADTIESRATYKDPYQEAVGLKYVIVNGQVVIEDSQLVSGVFPGQRLLAN